MTAAGFLLESVEHGERWSRFSFVGRAPVATLVLRDGRVEVEGALPDGVPRDKGILAALEVVLDRYRAPRLPDLPPLQSGVVGYLGYDVVREIERLPDGAARRSGPAGRRDERHRLPGRLRPLAPAGLPHRQRAGPGARRRRAGRRLRRRRPPGGGPVGRSGPAAELLGRGAARSRRAAARRSAPPCPAACTSRRSQVAKEHIRAGDIFQVVLAQRYDLELDADPYDVYRVLRQVNPSPYMYFLRHPEITIVGSSPEPMVQLLRRTGDLAAHRRHPPPRARPTRTTGAWPASCGRTPRRWPSTSCWSTWPATTSAASPASAPMHVDELLTLERYSHVMHLTSQVSGDLVDGRGPIDVLRATLPAGTVSGAPEGAGHGDHRRPRARQAGALRRGGRLHRLLRQPRHGHRHPHHVRAGRTAHRCRRARASSPTPSPTTRTSSAGTRRPRCWPRCRRRGG